MIIKHLHLYNSLHKTKLLIISIFLGVPPVPRVKMERFAGVDTQTCALPQRGWRRVWDDVTICLCQTLT
jgi:hypothetical protein